jgi:hypothetical protein
MEPESSLPYSQVPATCPYPEPALSSPHSPSHFLKIPLNIILPSTTVLIKFVWNIFKVNSSAGNLFKVVEVDKNSWVKGRRSTGREA